MEQYVLTFRAQDGTPVGFYVDDETEPTTNCKSATKYDSKELAERECELCNQQWPLENFEYFTVDLSTCNEESMTMTKNKTVQEKSMKLGGGGRFSSLKRKFSHQKGINNPGALAASIGRKKYGNHRMASMAGKGRHRAAMHRHSAHENLIDKGIKIQAKKLIEQVLQSK